MNILSRQSSLIDNNKTKEHHVHIIGCGATGSHLANNLAKTGVIMHLYDYDKVEEHNLGNQIYTADYVGMNKAEALKKLLIDRYGQIFNYENIIDHPIKVTGQTYLTPGIVVLAIDSVQGRVDIGRTLTSELIICPGIPANIRDDQLLLATGTIEVFYQDVDNFAKYLKRYENITDQEVEEDLKKELLDWGRGCDKQAFELLCMEVALHCAKIIMSYILVTRDVTTSARYDVSAVIPLINTTKYD